MFKASVMKLQCEDKEVRRRQLMRPASHHNHAAAAAAAIIDPAEEFGNISASVNVDSGANWESERSFLPVPAPRCQSGIGLDSRGRGKI